MLYIIAKKIVPLDTPVNALLVKNSCCVRAYLRGAFLCAGSMSDPEKSYHLEFVCSRPEQAGQLKDMIQEFQIEAKIIKRKKYYVVYLKEGSGIVDLLNVLGAHVSLMNLENLPDNLRQMAEIRLEHPDAPLKELGEYLEPAVGKSGVNHRLRRLSEIAEHMR